MSRGAQHRASGRINGLEHPSSKGRLRAGIIQWEEAQGKPPQGSKYLVAEAVKEDGGRKCYPVTGQRQWAETKLQDILFNAKKELFAVRVVRPWNGLHPRRDPNAYGTCGCLNQTVSIGPFQPQSSMILFYPKNSTIAGICLYIPGVIIFLSYVDHTSSFPWIRISLCLEEILSGFAYSGRWIYLLRDEMKLSQRMCFIQFGSLNI